MQTKRADQPNVNQKTFRWLFRVKPLDAILQDAEEPEHQLKRAPGPVQLTLFGIGAIIGAGIFATIGTAAAGDANRPGAGPALMVSFVITAIYVGYGSVNSRLTGREQADRPAEHNARTAYTGAWLAIIGVALLVLMRGFDIWLEALKTRKDITGSAKLTAALGDVFTSAPWLEVSWFLIVPLALNAFVLCPIVIMRALRAGRRRERRSAWHHVLELDCCNSSGSRDGCLFGVAGKAPFLAAGLSRLKESDKLNVSDGFWRASQWRKQPSQWKTRKPALFAGSDCWTRLPS